MQLRPSASLPQYPSARSSEIMYSRFPELALAIYVSDRLKTIAGIFSGKTITGYQNSPFHSLELPFGLTLNMHNTGSPFPRAPLNSSPDIAPVGKVAFVLLISR